MSSFPPSLTLPDKNNSTTGGTLEAAAGEPKRKRGRPKKLKGMPRRPLSAYNLFFKDERERIREKIQSGETPQDYENSVQEALKRVQGKTSAAEFQAIASTIAKRWKDLPAEERSKYEKLAESEMEAYQQKKFAYHRALVRDCANAAKTSILQQAESTAPVPPRPEEHKSDSLLAAAGGVPSWNMSLTGAMLPTVGILPQNQVFLPPLGTGIYGMRTASGAIMPNISNNAAGSNSSSTQIADAALSHALLLAEMQKRRQEDESAQRNRDLLRLYDSEIAALELRILQKQQFLQGGGGGGDMVHPSLGTPMGLFSPSGQLAPAEMTDQRTLMALLRQKQENGLGGPNPSQS